jgi:hypothetical protein
MSLFVARFCGYVIFCGSKVVPYLAASLNTLCTLMVLPALSIFLYDLYICSMPKVISVQVGQQLTPRVWETKRVNSCPRRCNGLTTASHFAYVLLLLSRLAPFSLPGELLIHVSSLFICRSRAPAEAAS